VKILLDEGECTPRLMLIPTRAIEEVPVGNIGRWAPQCADSFGCRRRTGL
jgi:hypothetical protein